MSENLASNAARQQYRPGVQAWLCAIGAWLFHLKKSICVEGLINMKI